MDVTMTKYIIERKKATTTILTQKEILMELFHTTNGPAWKKSQNWGTDEPLNRWTGVMVNESGEISGLKLSRNHLSGMQFDEVFFLKLTSLLF